MIEYLKDSSQSKEELLFKAEKISAIYPMLDDILEYYDKKASYKYNEAGEGVWINVELDPSKASDEEYKEKEANRFIDWFNIAVNEVVLTKYLKDKSQNNNELLFKSGKFNEVYKKMLGVILEQYDKKTSYEYNDADETVLIRVEVDSSKASDEEYKEEEANRFIDWWDVATHEIVIDDYQENLRKRLRS
ncbi:hypothetical protein [Methanobacterium sp.]|uniref:hypothetical protein n=1 Tax=Methanobacterium sp. TaxID=2164 RepID=UPI003C78DE27